MYVPFVVNELAWLLLALFANNPVMGVFFVAATRKHSNRTVFPK